MTLTTAEDVVRRAGVAEVPEYEDVSPMSDCAGFYAFRRYPAETKLAQIVTADGRPAVRCYLRFVVLPPYSTSLRPPRGRDRARRMGRSTSSARASAVALTTDRCPVALILGTPPSRVRPAPGWLRPTARLLVREGFYA